MSNEIIFSQAKASAEIKDGILDLSQYIQTSIEVIELPMSRLILPAGVEELKVIDCTELQHLTLPRGLKRATIIRCPKLGSNLVIEGLPESLVLTDPQDLYGWSSQMLVRDGVVIPVPEPADSFIKRIEALRMSFGLPRDYVGDTANDTIDPLLMWKFVYWSLLEDDFDRYSVTLTDDGVLRELYE